MKLPAYLYRYRPALDEYNSMHVERLLVHNELCFSAPSKFNDPFDCKPISGFLDVDKSSWSEIENDYRILCFSRTKKNILMWSHYSTGHRGFCLEFKVNNKNRFKYVSEVVYGIKREAVLDNDSDEVFATKFFFTKYKRWAYEKEWRLLLYRKKHQPVEPKNMIKTFEPELLTAIIFGCQMPKEDEKQILDWVSEGKCNPKFYKAREKSDRFGLDILPFKQFE